MVRNHVARIVVDIRHDVLGERAQELLTTAHVHARCVLGCVYSRAQTVPRCATA
jgi:hypothetical protein